RWNHSDPFPVAYRNRRPPYPTVAAPGTPVPGTANSGAHRALARWLLCSLGSTSPTAAKTNRQNLETTKDPDSLVTPRWPANNRQSLCSIVRAGYADGPESTANRGRLGTSRREQSLGRVRPPRLSADCGQLGSRPRPYNPGLPL